MSGNTIKQVLQHANQKLSPLESARLDCEVLLACVLNKERSYLYTYPDYILTAKQAEHYLNLIEQRQKGMPVAYLCGKQDFWSMSFMVSPDVLIPRPETEIIVEQVLNNITNQPERFTQKNLIDLGTGSGCIAIALAKSLADWQITAVDQSSKALDIAKHNASKHKVNNIQFIESNWFEKLDSTTYDIIVSNPPYISADDSDLDTHVAQYEPQAALIAANNGLSDYQTIIQHAPEHMHKQSLLVLEIGYTQAQAVETLLTSRFQNICVLKDLQQHDRVVMADIKT